MFLLLIPLIPLLSSCSGSPVAVLQTCSSLAPEFVQPILQEAQFIANDLSDMDMEMEMLLPVMKLLVPGMDKFVLSEMVVPIPGMGEMTVKSVVQMEISKLYSMMKMEIEEMKEQGMTEEDLPMIKKMRDGEMKKEIMKMSKMFFKDFHEAHTMVNMVLNTMKKDNPYMDMVEGYATAIGKMFEDQEGWDQSQETIMCSYDVVADGDDLDMADMLQMYFPREEVAAHSERLHKALHTIFKSPYLGEAARTVAKVLLKEIMGMDVDSMLHDMESILMKLRDRVTEIPFEKEMFLFQEMTMKTLDMMMIGQAPELEKMVDSLVFMMMEDSFWETLDMEMMYAPEMMYEFAKMMALDNGMLSEGCDVDQNPFLCCFKTRAKNGLLMVEHLAADVVAEDLEHCVENLRMMMEWNKMMVQNMMMMADMMLEKHMIGCMMDPMIVNGTEEMRMMMQEMMMTTEEDGASPITTLNYVMDNSLEMIQMAYGGCPEGSMPEPEPWAESEPESEPDSEPESEPES
jgi:hypothetical protein